MRVRCLLCLFEWTRKQFNIVEHLIEPAGYELCVLWTHNIKPQLCICCVCYIKVTNYFAIYLKNDMKPFLLHLQCLRYKMKQLTMYEKTGCIASLVQEDIQLFLT